MSGVRSAVEGDAALLGAVVSSNVTKSTDVVVVGGAHAAHGRKEQEATALNIKMIPEVEWNNIVADYVSKQCL